MKISKRVILISVFSIFIFSSFLIPRVGAQEWIYDGVDTTNIPGSSVYPSEWYVYEPIVVGPPSGLGYLFEIVKGNMTIVPLIGNSTSVWGDFWGVNLTSGEKLASGGFDVNFGNWNETFGYISLYFLPFIIPVENNGIVSLPILNNVSVYFELAFAPYEFEHHQIYPNINSIAFWNTSNNAYYNLNYTNDGILTRVEMDTGSFPISLGNCSLYSQPAQLPPSFTFTTEDDILAVNSTDFKLVVDITDADNNNDGIIDTDYQYRIYNGTGWTAWAAIPTTIDYSLGSVATGNYSITMNVKNMYGITSKIIQIQYTAPSGDGGTPEIPGYSIILISIALLLGISFLIQKNRKKM